jgi:3-hydroxypropanoate dehydrogenase
MGREGRMSAPPLPDLLALDAGAQALLFRAARTANTFTDEPVTDEQVRAVHDLIRYGPTGFNAQPLRILLLRSAESRRRLLPHLSTGNRAKTAAAPLVVLLAADTAFHEHLPRVFPHRQGLREWLDTDAASREAQARFNAAVQIGYFVVGVRAAGLAAGPMAGFDPAGVDAEFFPDGRLRSLLLVNIGRPGPHAWADRLPRLDHDDVVRTL